MRPPCHSPPWKTMKNHYMGTHMTSYDHWHWDILGSSSLVEFQRIRKAPARTLAFFSKSFNWVSLTHIVFSSKAYFSWYWWFQPLWKIWIRQSQLGLSYIYGKNVPSHQAVLRFQHVPTGRNTNGSPVGQPRDDQTCHICRWSPSLHPPRGMANLWFKRWSSVGFLR